MSSFQSQPLFIKCRLLVAQILLEFRFDCSGDISPPDITEPGLPTEIEFTVYILQFTRPLLLTYH